MKSVVGIFSYILHYNSFWMLPYRFFLTFLFQLYKHTIGGTFSKRLFNGKSAFIFPKCAISSQFVYAPIPDRAEIETLRKLCDEKTVFLDIGANVGAYSIMLCDVARGGIYSFEPHPFTAGRCKMNFLLNLLDERRVIQVALADRIGEVNFTNDTNISAMNKITEDKSGSISVPVTTLDAWIESAKLKEDTNFIVKIDVEGFEEAVLKGAAKFLTTANIRGVVIEIFDEHLEKITAIFRDIGYVLTNINGANYLAQRAEFVR
jgi:FkbM family methyltransferase